MPLRNASRTQTSFEDLNTTSDTRSLCAEVLRWEACPSHMYVDRRGFVATGARHTLPTVDAAIALPWRHGASGRPTTAAEIARAFVRVRDLGPRQKTLSYRLASDLVLPAGVAGDLAITQVERNVLPGLRRLCPHFDRHPLPARRALVDMAFDLGLAALSRFHNLIAACAARDFATAANHCHRRGGRETRNAATRLLFLEAANLSA
jgi:hypothetical protein